MNKIINPMYKTSHFWSTEANQKKENKYTKKGLKSKL